MSSIDWSPNLPFDKQALYLNQAEVRRVVDGDTLVCQGILSFHIEDSDLRLRLRNLFCFETRKPSNKILAQLEPELTRLNLKDRNELIKYMKLLGKHCKSAMENLVAGERIVINTYPAILLSIDG